MSRTTCFADERQARLGVRHHLARPASSLTTVAGDLVGLHATDPASVYLAALARVKAFSVPMMEQALYDNRTLVRMLGMRRTMFVVPIDVAATMDAACTKRLAPGERKRTITMIENGGLAKDGRSWLTRVEKATLAALDELQEATAVQLGKKVPDLRKKVAVGEGKKWAGEIGMSTRVLFLLANEGRVVRGRPNGSWLSSQYKWAAVETWLGEPLDLAPAAEARADLVRRWLQTYGPGTRADIAWWAKWTVRDTTAALEAVGAEIVELDGGTEGFVLPGDHKPTRKPTSWVAFLPALDPTIMGWKERDWYLGDHGSSLFDRNGNAGPTIWSNGRVIGGWAQRADASVTYELLEKVDAATAKRVRAEAAKVEKWLDGVLITPRFRTPLEKALRSA